MGEHTWLALARLISGVPALAADFRTDDATTLRGSRLSGFPASTDPWRRGGRGKSRPTYGVACASAVRVGAPESSLEKACYVCPHGSVEPGNLEIRNTQWFLHPMVRKSAVWSGGPEIGREITVMRGVEHVLLQWPEAYVFVHKKLAIAAAIASTTTT